MKKYLWLFALITVTLTACSKKEQAPAATPAPATTASAAATPVNSEEKVLNIYNWPDYIPDGMIADFEKESGIKVNYDTFETNEALHAKLVAGNTGYDIVVPGAAFAKPQIEGGLLQPLDKSKISNLANLDPAVYETLTKADPGNKYLIPWGWSFTTVGINKAKVAKALGNMPMPTNTWDLVFNPEYTAKLKSCGIAYLDSPTEVMQVALLYVGKDSFSNNPDDYKVAAEMLAKVRKDIRLFSATMIDDLAGGKACAVVGWAGDINIAAARAKEIDNNDGIEALLPSIGAVSFFDTMAITKDAKHPNNAHAFINFYLRPENAARMSNEMGYNSGNKAAVEKVNAEMASNKSIFVEAEYMAKLVKPSSYTNEAREAMAQAYNSFKQGK